MQKIYKIKISMLQLKVKHPWARFGPRKAQGSFHILDQVSCSPSLYDSYKAKLLRKPQKNDKQILRGHNVKSTHTIYMLITINAFTNYVLYKNLTMYIMFH